MSRQLVDSVEFPLKRCERLGVSGKSCHKRCTDANPGVLKTATELIIWARKLRSRRA